MPVPFICSYTPVAISYRSCSWLVSHKDDRHGGQQRARDVTNTQRSFKGTAGQIKKKNLSFLMSLSHHKIHPEPERCLAEKTDSTGCSASILQHKLTAVREKYGTLILKQHVHCNDLEM